MYSTIRYIAWMAALGKIKAWTYRRWIVLESLKMLCDPSDDSQPKSAVVPSKQCHSEAMLSMKYAYKRSEHAQNNARKHGKDQRTVEPGYTFCLPDKRAKVHACSWSQRKECGYRRGMGGDKGGCGERKCARCWMSHTVGGFALWGCVPELVWGRTTYGNKKRKEMWID